MDYEKAYKDALERMKSWARGEHPECFAEAQKAAEFIFPELAESEDERIRKRLICGMNALKDQKKETFAAIPIDDCIAWLEKQGKEEYVLKSSKDEDVRKFMQYIEKEAKAYEFNLPNRSYDIYAFAKDILVWLEKQCKQKPIDKVEPKFKVGDWITDGYLHNKITDVLEDRYIVETKFVKRSAILYDYESRYHLWTIQDAKDGDVLFSDLMCGKTFIYNGINSDMAILYSFIISNDGDDVLPYHIGKPNTGIGTIEDNKNIIHPATKEQRDHLFAKMREAGYEWDEEKKELRKIGNFPILSNSAKTGKNWSEEDEKCIDNCCLLIGAADNCYEKTFKDDCIHYLQNLKKRMGI